MATTTYTLQHPIELKKGDGTLIEKIEVVTFKRLRGEHASQITATAPMPMLVQMIGLSCGLPPSTMKLMDFDDILAAAEVGADFFGGKGLMDRLSK